MVDLIHVNPAFYSSGDNSSACPLNVPDNPKLTERELTRLAKRLGSCWIELLGLLNIDYETQQNIPLSSNLYRTLLSKEKEVLQLYNGCEDFSRKVLAQLVTQDLKLPCRISNVDPQDLKC